VLVYGHVETALERAAHLRALRTIADEAAALRAARTAPSLAPGAVSMTLAEADVAPGGFREFIPMPHPSGTPLVAGRSALDEHRAMTAVARLALAGSIAHIQVPWPRLGDDEAGRAAARALLRAGANDLGGTLFDGRVRPDAGAEAGHEMTPDQASRIVGPLLRPLRQRTTTYADVPAARRLW
jgi:FO synthase